MEAYCGDTVVDTTEMCEDDADCFTNELCSACQCEIQPYCGDGTRDTSEECDDGNEEDGDGCSALCIEEDGWVCSDEEGCEPLLPKLPVGTCGNGQLESPIEECDDGNRDIGDGCDDMCSIEDGWACSDEEGSETICVPLFPGLPISTCGNGTVDFFNGEQCDDGNIWNGDGCSSLCQREKVCGNNFVENNEECDDGNKTSGDGCSSNCQREYCGDGTVQSVEECEPPNTSYCDSYCRRKDDDDDDDDDDGYSRPRQVCGDGSLQGSERCEYDWHCPEGQICDNCGCKTPTTGHTNPMCGNGKQETGEDCEYNWQCPVGEFCLACSCEVQSPEPPVVIAEPPVTTIPTVVTPVARCGNNIVEHGEECDDGNLVGGDDCSPTCTIEIDTYVAAAPLCGDGIIQEPEQCDDGNMLNGDGCSTTCTLEQGAEIAQSPICGNSVIEPPEECEGDWHCPSGICLYCHCESLPEQCGNGTLEGSEQCDDGNRMSGDGCSGVCVIEQLSKPNPGCGNGILESNEQCDDGNRREGDGCSALCKLEIGTPRPTSVLRSLATIQPIMHSQAPVGDTGPAAAIFTAAGAAAGLGWMRRRKKQRS